MENVKDNEQLEEIEGAPADTPAFDADEAPVDYPTRPEEDRAANRRKEIWDKFTTALLILVLTSPLFIVAYIVIWFLSK